jgi:colanic acid/amylovoran biosynthesis protein
MIIEVTGTNTWNKGAELMLIAVQQHFRNQHPAVALAVDQFFGAYQERAQYGLLQKVTLDGWGRSKLAMHLLPGEFRRSFGLVREDDVNVILDAAGFAFGDQHPPSRAIQFAERVEAAKKAGKKVVLLPQALGPFRRTAVRDAFRRIVGAADLVFARDETSKQHAVDAVGMVSHLHKAPDFTNQVKPKRSMESNASDRVCIVPNQRMIEKAEDRTQAERYVPFMAQCIKEVEAVGLRPVLLLHGEDDLSVAERIREQVGHDIPLHKEEDPIAIKRFLGESHVVIGSRFHALIGALSQGVPSIGTSWSHKYERLFEDYHCQDMLLAVSAHKEQIRARIRTTTSDDRADLVQRIKQASRVIESSTKDMWRRVDRVIGLA